MPLVKRLTPFWRRGILVLELQFEVCHRADRHALTSRKYYSHDLVVGIHFDFFRVNIELAIDIVIGCLFPIDDTRLEKGPATVAVPFLPRPSFR